MRRSVALLLAACLALLAAGCGDSPPSFALGSITVVDEAGLVTAATTVDPPRVDAYVGAPKVVSPDGQLDRLLLLWVEDSCVTATTITLGGNALELRIATTEPTGCYGTITNHALQLDLDRVVDATAISVSQQPAG